jgi:hypothetical protein
VWAYNWYDHPAAEKAQKRKRKETGIKNVYCLQLDLDDEDPDPGSTVIALHKGPRSITFWRICKILTEGSVERSKREKFVYYIPVEEINGLKVSKNEKLALAHAAKEIMGPEAKFWDGDLFQIARHISSQKT